MLIVAAVVAAALGSASDAQSPPVIAETRPLACATPDTHPAITASVTPAPQIVDVRVFFRTLDPAPKRAAPAPRGAGEPPAPRSSQGDPTARLEGLPSGRETFSPEDSPGASVPRGGADGSGWYRVRLEQQGGTWRGVLPRPTSRLRKFAYYIEVFDAAARVVRGEERSVRVAQKGAHCAPAETDTAAPKQEVMVQAPAFDSAPVPDGFSTKGSHSTGASRVGVTRMGQRLSLLASLAAGATAGAVALTTYKPEEGQSNVELISAEPAQGSTISLAAPRVAIRLRLMGPQDVEPGAVVVRLRRSLFDCVTLRVPHDVIRARTPVEVTVDQVAGVFCPAPFETSAARVEVRGPGERLEFGRELPLSYTFVP